MKKLYLSLIAIVSIFFAQAQNDANAKKILDAVNAKVKTFKAVTGNFTIKTFTNKGKLNGTKTGSISMKGNKYLIKQAKTEIICDGNKTYTYDGSKTITVAAAEDANKSLTPQKILSGSYDKDFTYKLITTTGNISEIELLPIDKKKNFQKVNIFIDKAKNFINKAKVLDKSNNVLEFTFSNLNTNATVNENTFSFNKAKYPKDVEILD